MTLETVSQMRKLRDVKVRRYQYETLSWEEYVMETVVTYLTIYLKEMSKEMGNHIFNSKFKRQN